MGVSGIIKYFLIKVLSSHPLMNLARAFMNRLSSLNGLKPIWKNSRCFSALQLPKEIRAWLLYPDSLTEQLKKECKHQKKKMHIVVLEEHLEFIPDLAFETKIFDCRLAYARHIQIYSDSTLLMYAKSLMPKNDNVMRKRQFRGLGEKPLGEILFAMSGIIRSAFELSKIPANFTEYKLTHNNEQLSPAYIWARRSIFSNPLPFLCLTEYFAPDFFALMTTK